MQAELVACIAGSARLSKPAGLPELEDVASPEMLAKIVALRHHVNNRHLLVNFCVILVVVVVYRIDIINLLLLPLLVVCPSL